MTNGWRTHAQLAGRFHPDYPDDVQVIVHDGGPRITQARPEAVWVTVTAMDGDVFRGRVHNEPQQLKRVRLGEEIRFLVAAGAPHPVLVTEKYLRERDTWTVHPCNKCGLSELFDAPSELFAATFHGLPPGAQPEMFTAFCPLCSGAQVVELKTSSLSAPAHEPATAVTRARRPWWRFWK